MARSDERGENRTPEAADDHSGHGCHHFLEHQSSAVSQQFRDRLTALSADHEIVTSVVTYEEQTRGWMAKFSKARKPQEIVEAYSDLLEHLRIYSSIDVVPYTRAAEAMMTELRGRKIRIATRDMRIASVALCNQAILMTRNLKDFAHVPGLIVEDWTKL